MSNSQLAKVGFIVALCGVLFSIHPIVGGVNIGPVMWGFCFSVKYFYFTLLGILGMSVYFYAIGFAFNRLHKMMYLVGHFFYALMIILPPLYIVSWALLKWGPIIKDMPWLANYSLPLLGVAASYFSAALSWSSIKKENISLMNQPLTPQSLRQYTFWKFPKLGVSDQWHDRIINDIEKAGLTEKIRTIEDVNRSIDRAKKAVSGYKKENPDWFKTGTDHITKSLGFCHTEFRQIHNFARKTRDAFSKYDHLVGPEENN